MLRAATTLALALVLAVPALAHASTATSVTLDGRAAATLRAEGVRFIAIPPATLTGTRWQLPARPGTGTGAGLRYAGGLLLRRSGGRALALTSLRRTSGRSPLLTVMVGGRRTTLARLSTTTIPTVTLTAGAGQRLRRRLGLSRTPQGSLGRLRFVTLADPGASTPSTPATGTPSGPSGPASPEPGGNTVCAAASSTTPAGPAAPARPAGARDVVAASLTWHVRDSFIDYIASGQGTSAVDGAIAAPASGDPPLARSFSFPLRDGWFDPASGTAAVRFTGCVRFAYALHGIGIETQNPELEVAPGAARAVARFSGASAAPGRSVLADLTWAPPATAGATATWSTIPAKIPDGAATSVFAGFYYSGDPFGSFTLSVTTGG